MVKNRSTGTEKLLVTMPSGEKVERTWGRSRSLKLKLSDVDPTIRSLVKEYRDLGIETLGSCAGHRGRGFVTFTKDVDKEEVKSVAKRFGCSNLRFSKLGDFVSMSFSPMEAYSKVEVIS